jgi:HAD superfamily hydrolase (TIGR01509 family)
MRHRFTAVLFDIDGTLIDSNDAHAAAWVNAFREHGVEVDPGLVRRCIGMGGDKLMPKVSGIKEESARGAAIAARRGEIFLRDYLPRLTPFEGARDLVAAIKERGYAAVAASSASEKDLKALLAVANADALMDDSTSSDDAEDSKPAPDIIHAALRKAKASPSAAVMIGDTPYDIEAAQRAGVQTIAFRCGGWQDADLKGAIAVYDGPWDLFNYLDTSPLAEGA